MAEARRSDRGRLKIFLGAAPGVGKTFEMLSVARRKLAEGADVVVGIVETHGRAETEALLQGLPQIARRKLEYRGRVLDELDLDALLDRNPRIALVDELAHTNVPGSRHAKRYQDVQELLSAGIDVYTTLNVQHLESFNDLVVRITGVEIRETVPDAIIEQAHDVELIDLAPDDLIERDYDVPGRALRMTLQITNSGEQPLRIGEFTTAGIRFLNKVGVANNLDPTYPPEIMAQDGLHIEDESPINPGETKEVKLDSRDSLWEVQRLMDLVHDPDQRFGGLLMSWDESGNRHINSIAGNIIPVFTRAVAS